MSGLRVGRGRDERHVERERPRGLRVITAPSPLTRRGRGWGTWSRAVRRGRGSGTVQAENSSPPAWPRSLGAQSQGGEVATG